MCAFYLLLVLMPLAQSAITDTNCTVGGKYAPTAFNCADKISSAACAAKFSDTAGGAASLAVGDVNRDAKCFTLDATAPAPDDAIIDEDMKAAAIATCPMYCGYCCLTPEYDCADAPFPKLDCSRITQAQCDDTSFRPIIATECPSACGFCLTGGCIDASPDCELQPQICNIKGLESFVATQCQRTCNLCSTATTTVATSVSSVTTGTTTSCTSLTNTNNNCAAWIANGFCTNAFYPVATRVQNCAAGCCALGVVG